MELLAPAGGWDAFIAAVENGADAVYIGGTSFSARQSAQNFDNEQIKAAVDYAHLRDRKVYVTVNTLIDNNEFGEVLDYIFKLHNNNVDAIIVQDLGLMDAVTKTMPMVRVHASTQMTIHNADGVNFLREQGIKRIVLARELSYNDLLAIRRETGDMELEIFVHGALCYCYSGQCLFSSIVGGRSGNRGRCAQPCRLGYDLYSGKKNTRMELPGQGRHLLSPADLCLLDYLGKLQEAGVSSLKIEGRMKRPEYVAIVTRTYREVLDELQANPNYKPPAGRKNDLLKIFNRNFTTGYLSPGLTPLLSTQRPNNRGVYIGRVVEQDHDFNTGIKINDRVTVGDGLDIWVKKGKGPAFVVREMIVNGQKVTDTVQGDIISIKLDSRVFPGDRVFKTHDEKVLSQAMESIRAKDRSRIPVNIEVYLELGKPMKLVFTDKDNNEATVYTVNSAQKAVKRALDLPTLKEKLERMGNTPFVLENLIAHGVGELIVPFSDINEARRQGTDILMKQRLVQKQTVKMAWNDYVNNKNNSLCTSPTHQTNKGPLLNVAVSNYNQARQALQAGADRIYIGLEGLGTHKRLTEAELEQLLEYGKQYNRQIVPIIPRIRKPTDTDSTARLINKKIGSVMVGNIGALKWVNDRKIPAMADYTFNIFNQYTFNFLLNQGLSGFCLSPELNFKQLQEFSNFDKVELLVHGELTLMVSQYCMLAGVLGDNGVKCKGFCLKGDYHIRDDRGYEFPVETDADCRFYVFNSRTLCMMDDLDKIIALRPGSIRIEARRSGEQDIFTVVKLYRQALDKLLNKDRPDLNWYKEELARISGSSFTKCHYYRGVL